MSKIWENNDEIEIFREYLRIASVHPDIDYEPCVTFLRKQATSLDLPIQMYNAGGNEKKPIVVITWIGTQPSLPSIVLNSHMDVVPVYPEKWTHPPFDAYIDDDGKIFARGTQDMKSVGCQHLAAIRALKKSNQLFKRTIHIMFVPDEEIGGAAGMGTFVNSDEFRALNVGFSLDEGIASPNNSFPLFYGERSAWFISFKCFGPPGHGSLLHKNTAGENVAKILAKFLDFRQKEVNKLEDNPELTIGDVTTINLTFVKGGVQVNVVPPEMEISFDCRLALTVSHSEFEDMLKRWADEAGGAELNFKIKSPRIEPTKVDDSNQFWLAFKEAINELELNITTQVFTGATDSRYLRGVGIPAIGFSPLNNTPILLHDNDEYILADTYLKGIDIFKTIISKVGNVDAQWP